MKVIKIGSVLIIIGLMIGLFAVSSPITTVKAAVSDNLIACWDMNETSGTRYDSKGSNHLTDNNTVGYAAGVIGNAASFDAANQESLTISDNTDISSGDVDFTFLSWIFVPDQSTDVYTVSKGIEYAIKYLVASDRLACVVNSSAVTAGTFGNVPNDQYLMVLCSYDSVNNLEQISVNAGAVNSGSKSSGADTASGLYFSRTGSSSYYTTKIDISALWKRLLTTEEKSWLYNSGAGRQCSELISAPTQTPTATSTSTVTPTPTITPTPTATPTPATKDIFVMSSGNILTVDKQFNYGDIILVSVVILLIIVLIILGLMGITKQWLR